MPPFDAAIRYPSKLTMPANAPASAALTLPTYSGWLLPCAAVSLANLPAVSVPVGVSASGGLPIGVQLVGRPGGEAALLASAAILERAVAKRGGTSFGAVVDPTQARAAPTRPPAAWEWDGPRTAAEAAALHGVAAA